MIYGHFMSCILSQHYRVVLLIPDIYVHKHVKAMVELLLNNLGFEAVIVHQVLRFYAIVKIYCNLCQLSMAVCLFVL